MRATLSILAGLVVGIAVAGLVLVGILALAPDPVASSSPAPSLVAASATPSAGPSSTPLVSAVPSASVVDAPFHIGRPAPALSVPKVGGGTIDLATLKGKPVWINFMATWCPSCQDEFPLMNEFATRYADDGLVVVAVDVRESEAAVTAFADGLGATFPMGLDADGSAHGDWAALALPVHFWVDAEGIVRHGAVGGLGPDVMVEGLESILPGVDVSL